MNFSLEAITGLFLAIVVPVLFWCWRVSSSQKAVIKAIDDLTEMHLDDESVFSTRRTENLLSEHMKEEETMYRATLAALNRLDNTISELTYYVKWLNKQTSGKSPPPFLADKN